jgi:ribosomal protein L11 methyltransferase
VDKLWNSPGQMSSSPESSVTVVAHLDCDRATARRLADALAETFDAVDAAVAAFERPDGGWSFEAHFGAPPDEAALRALVGTIAGDAAAQGLVLETVAARDWVVASLAGLKPVAAGRFLVHGAHDRAHVPAHRIGIEIEAALAFGTGHHGTTRGCLLALDAWLKRIRLRAPRYGGQARGRVKVLDIGTGTGVLAIAAAKALRAQVIASDIDAGAVAVARANARANAAGALVEVVRAGAACASAARSISCSPTSCWRRCGGSRRRSPARWRRAAASSCPACSFRRQRRRSPPTGCRDWNSRRASRSTSGSPWCWCGGRRGTAARRLSGAGKNGNLGHHMRRGE